jgi:hypothetical protein
MKNTRSSGLEMLKGREERANETYYNDVWLVRSICRPFRARRLGSVPRVETGLSPTAPSGRGTIRAV